MGAAVAQSSSYIFSRHFISRHGSSFRLLVLAQVIMGLMALVLLPFVVGNGSTLAPIKVFWLPLMQCSIFFLFGQLSFFLALKYADASRVSPMLGLKIITIALLSYLFFGDRFSIVQWIAVVVCLIGAVMTNWSGGTISLKGFVFIIFACIGYSLSDLNIKVLIDVMGEGSLPLRSMQASVLCYVVCGIMAVAAYCWMPNKSLKAFKNAVPFSICWFMAMLMLFACFGFIGPVFGNIVQATRGIISILIGVMIARAGYEHLESKSSGGVVVRRIVAAVLMITALLMFSFSSQITGFLNLDI